jgi:DNA-binding SARP family transcriptional activator
VADLRFRVLGPVEVLRDEHSAPAPVTGKRSLPVLAGLLISANDIVSADRLIEWAWPTGLPAHPRGALQNAVSRLRQQVGSTRIESLRWGYRLRADASSLDLLMFEELIAEAETAMSAGLPEVALAALDKSLSLWREPLLGNVDSGPLWHEAVSSLYERYLRTAETRAELRLQLGLEKDLAGELSRLVRANPYRERLVGLLMIALTRGGRRVEALATYDALRSSLRREMGIDPASVLRDLHMRILRDDPILGVPPVSKPRDPEEAHPATAGVTLPT